MWKRFVAVVLMVSLLWGCAPRSHKSFVVMPRIERNLGFIAEGLDKEIPLCLTGVVRPEQVIVLGIAIPEIVESTETSAVSRLCPETTVARWHNHPVKAKQDWYCALSDMDIIATMNRPYPVVVVQTDFQHSCWWTKIQVEDAVRKNGGRIPLYMGRIEGQYTTAQDTTDS